MNWVAEMTTKVNWDRLAGDGTILVIKRHSFRQMLAKPAVSSSRWQHSHCPPFVSAIPTHPPLFLSLGLFWFSLCWSISLLFLGFLVPVCFGSCPSWMQNESIKTMSLELFQGICSILVPSKGNKGKSSALSLVVLRDFDTSDFSEAFHKDA